MKKKLQKIFAMILAVSMIMSMLTVGASAAETKYICGEEAHTHSSACYKPVLVCKTEACEKDEHTHGVGEEFGCVPHGEHDDDCYVLNCNLDGQLECGETPHTCTDACVDCTLPNHEHDDGCYHEHDDNCYVLDCELGAEDCELEEHSHEAEGCHIHDAKACYKLELDCGKEIHVHNVWCKVVDKNKTAEWNDADRTIADVTLSVPGDVEALGTDIVFVMGNGPANDAKMLDYLIEAMEEILSTFGDSGATVKFGLVAFSEGGNEDIMGLTEMTEGNVESTIETALNAYGTKGDSYSGVNLHSALLTAKGMLDSDDTVPADRKHMIVISTGLTYFFDDEDGNTSTVVITDARGEYCWGNLAWLRARNNTTSTTPGYPIPFGWTWDEYWENIVTWVENDGNDYVYTLTGTEENPGDTWYRLNNSGENSDRHRADCYGYWIQNEADKAAAAAVAVPHFAGGSDPETTPAANHAINYERAWYESWKVFTAMEEAGYNCYSVANGAPVWLQDNQAGRNFMDMLAGGKAPVYSETEDFFAPIREKILRSVSAGSYVEDVIGYGDDYDFDFYVNEDASNLTLTVGDTKYTTAKLEPTGTDDTTDTDDTTGTDDTTSTGSTPTASYTFTAPGAAEATFTLDYFAGDPGDEKFIWTFKEDVSNFAPVSLNYQVELVQMQNDPTEATAKVETNKSATLYPEGGIPQEFPVPELIIPKYKVTYEYIGDVPSGVPSVPATKYYFAGNKVYLESDEDYKVDDYIFYGWNDPCNALAGGVMPAHDVTLTGYYVPVNENVDPPIGIKTDKETTGYDYEVTIAVPGDGEAVKVHEEVILIIDGSYSGDLEWDNMKANILEIGKKVLGGAGRTEMTIISFGMGDNLVAEGIKTMAELEEIMKATLPGDLLYGRSSTNCETGFNAALKYIQDKQDTLANVDVVFISDAGINTDETLRLFDDWRTLVKTANKGYIPGRNTVDFGRLSLDMACAGEELPAIYKTLFGDMTLEQVFADDFYPNISEETLAAWLDGVYAEVYAYSGLTPNTPYPISVVERAVVKIDKEKGTALQNTFYLLQKGNSVGDSYPNCDSRTIDAARELAKFPLVDKLYLVHHKDGRINNYHGNSGWVAKVGSCTVDGKDKAQYIKATDIANLLTDLAPMYADLSNTNYTDVVITDCSFHKYHIGRPYIKVRIMFSIAIYRGISFSASAQNINCFMRNFSLIYLFNLQGCYREHDLQIVWLR